MDSQDADFSTLTGPVCASTAFQRLQSITFLGVLSPDYRRLPTFPMTEGWRKRPKRDGTRAEHSLEVARIAHDIAGRLGFSETAKRYAVAWGLVHDIATWPLSHTGEAAFADVTGVLPTRLRERMVLGADDVPDRFSLYRPLKDLGVDHGLLLSLFDKRGQGPDGKDLRLFHMLIHSPLTPDTLEGIHRTSRVFDVKVPDPMTVAQELTPTLDLFCGAGFRQKGTRPLFQFWEAKSRIYRDFINEERFIEYESRWSQAICENFRDIGLWDSLELSERNILDTIASRELPRFNIVKKYKSPLSYQIADRYKNRDSLKSPVLVNDLGKIFIKRQLAL